MHKKLPITQNTKSHRNRSERSDFFIPKLGYLRLDDGTVFEGSLFNHVKICFGEVVFNTGMTGYVESLTDPSYTNQILVFTYPMIGNYGVQLDQVESERIRVSGVIVAESATASKRGDSDHSFVDWLQKQNIPLLTGVDTRALTKHLRVRGSMNGVISNKDTNKPKDLPQLPFSVVSEPIIYNSAKTKTIVLVDCGSKENIVRSLLKLPIRVKRVPHDYDYSSEPYDGILLSNGPGDPKNYRATIEIARKALRNNRPIFGICLGAQIMALAAGAKTYKLKFGHRGHNQPCQELATTHCYITSQNHGYAIDDKSLPAGWEVTFRNLNDGSVEGIRHRTKPYSSVQFHPEACPGPTDTEWLFERFYKSL